MNADTKCVCIITKQLINVKKLEAFLEQNDEKMLYEQATRAQASFNQADAISLDELMKKHSLDPAEVEAAVESVEIE